MTTPQTRPARTGSENAPASPLRLNLQFFAEGDPPKHDGFYATLKDVFKTNPHLKIEHNSAITEAVSDRFKSYNFDVEEAKLAMAEKKQREQDKLEGKDTESQQLKALKEKAKKLEDRTKALALEKYAGDAAKAKLMRRLAHEQIDKLQLNDDMELDAAGLDAVMTELRTEFPDLFPVPNPEGDPPPPSGDNNPPPPAGTQNPPNRSAGSSQRTNNPPPPAGSDIAAEVAETFKRLKDSHQI